MDVGIVRVYEGDMKACDVYGCWDCEDTRGRHEGG